MNKFKRWVFVILILCNTLVSSLGHRSRRFLTFPPTAPTRVQIISGIGIPVDLELESVTIGYVFKAEFFLPENASNYLNGLADPFDITTRPITGRRRRFIEETKSTQVPENTLNDYQGFDSEQNERFEKHLVDAEIIESGTVATSDVDEYSDERSWFEPEHFDRSKDPTALKGPQNLGTTRWTIYKGMAAIAESKGLSGKPCVLRSICESAHTLFDYSNGIIGELMHIVMSPSATQDEISDYSDLEYYRAERLGKEGAPCERVFKDCRISILEQFTGVYTPIMNMLSRLID
ncbi:uncharacterized protein LOC129580373 [Sitodiplosis mosellana]|uniref:uncharacterized protein LOC129580373 n=1 Tax=Sitodiplosis mosellana TaxID=263140 RepID=UPI00244440FE|nr:uncharacterized protein LOC129580373 [Sitodiplosis mosellana]